MTAEYQTLLTADGLKLHQITWRPSGQPRAQFVIVHGLGEHASRYDHLVQALNAAGISVHAIDLRGHGRSEGRLGHTPSMDAYIDDLTLLLDSLPGQLPIFVYGHSLGGLIAVFYNLRHQGKLRGQILSAPAFQRRYEVPLYKVILGRTLSQIWPTFTQPTGLNPDDLSQLTEVVEAYRNDPLVHDKASARFFTSMTDAGPEAIELASQITLPTAVIQGGNDRIISAEASRKFFDQLAAEDKTWIYLPDEYHETHNEADGPRVIQQIVEWVSARV